MKTKLSLCVLGIAMLAGAAVRRTAPVGEPVDLLIRNGRIVDGSGNPWYFGSVAVRDGRIVAVGRIGDLPARRTLDAQGKVVAPGFIDLHTHSDYTLLVDGNAESKIRQGVTTEILGESASAGPVLGPAVEPRQRELQMMGLNLDWRTLGEYFQRLERQGIAVNVASYVASGQLWMDVLGNRNRRPTPGELHQMEQLAEQAMRDGALGLSSGLIYPPDRYFTTDELVQLARVAARHGGIYTAHIRGEGNTVLQAVDEAVEIGRRAGLPVHILHLKVAGKANWGRMPEVVHRIEQARAAGVEVTADVYPYIAAQTDLHMCLPPRLLEGTREELLARLRDPAVRAELRRELAPGSPGWVGSQVQEAGGWHGVMVGSVHNEADRPYQGLRMDEVARKMGEDPVDALCDLLLREGGSAGAIYFLMDEADLRTALVQPWVGIGSDGSAVNPEMPFAGFPHPRFYGTFPRVLARYVREQRVLALPDAIRKMTSLPAQIVGLSDRGLLRPGMAADIVVFDPEHIADRATFENPRQYAVGIAYVVVNGQVVFEQGRHTGARPGRVLRHQLSD
jgi:N-acyl-D-amino-acid deacylase